MTIDTSDNSRVCGDLLRVDPAIRYVAVYRDRRLASRVRKGLDGASADESDRYEELLVNPTLVTIAGQRGRIDCGGLEFLIVRYGNFWQIVTPVPGGHVSVAVESLADPISVAALVRARLAELGIAEAPRPALA